MTVVLLEVVDAERQTLASPEPDEPGKQHHEPIPGLDRRGERHHIVE